MTMANSAVSSTPRNGVSLRKTNKPLMEKRRRARINDSLTQLKSLVIHSSKKDSSQFSKLEKADILELTVKHLRGMQQQQQQQQQQQANSSDNPTTSKYRAGFMECANEVIRYLDQSQGFSNDTKAKVISHLAQCLQLVSHVQPKQVTAPPAPATTILKAPPATTATTQLPNGQIIQIVSNPVQNIQPTAANGILGFKQPVSSLQGFNLTPGLVPSSSVSATPQSNATTSQTAYVRYAQPLHIQIPPMVSPVLIQQTQPPKVATAIATETTKPSIGSSSADRHHNQEVVSSSTNMASPPSASSLSSASSSSPSHSSLPKVRAQKQLNFYSPEEMNIDLLARSRTYSFTSSSSSSSPEAEMTSPLNLSQSPPYPSQKHKTLLPHHHQPASFSSSSSSSMSSVSHSMASEHFQVSQPIPVKAHDKTAITTIPAHHNGLSLSIHDRNSALNATSVIVNSRKYSDFSDAKYFAMMDDDRHCMNHPGTPSPASSMGEERLWRPW